MNKKVFIDKFIKAYLASSAQEASTVLRGALEYHFKTVQDVVEFLKEPNYAFVNNIHDTFYSSLTDEEKLEWALIS